MSPLVATEPRGGSMGVVMGSPLLGWCKDVGSNKLVLACVVDSIATGEGIAQPLGFSVGFCSCVIFDKGIRVDGSVFHCDTNGILTDTLKGLIARYEHAPPVEVCV